MNQKEADEMMAEMDAKFAEEIRVRALMEYLEIPYEDFQVHISELDKIFSDPQRCQRLVSRLKLKAFW